MKNRALLIILSIILSQKIYLAQANFSLSAGLCKNDTAILMANTGTMSNCSFTWTCNPAGGNFSAPGSSMTSLSFASSGTFTIYLAISSGTVVSSAQNTINSLALPSITLSQSSLTTCVTNNFPAFSKPVHLVASGGVSYSWSPGPSGLNGNPNGPTNDVRPPVTTCYSVTGMDVNGCSALALICVTVIPRFSITILPSNTLICNNQQINEVAVLTATNVTSPAFGLPATYAYTWFGGSPSSILSSPFAAVVTVAPMSIFTYTAEVRDSLNCVSLPATAVVNVYNCTGIKDNSLVREFRIYPNPFSDRLYIETPDNSKSISVCVWNALGEVILHTEIRNGSIDLSSLNKGIYILECSLDGAKKNYRMVKD